jgi:hypothetical protein
MPADEPTPEAAATVDAVADRPPERPWRAAWRRRKRSRAHQYVEELGIIRKARSVLEADPPAPKAEQLDALEAMRRIASDERAGPHCRVGAANTIARHEARVAERERIAEREAEMRRRGW